MMIPGSLEVPLILHWYRRCPDNQCVFRLHLNRGRGSTSMGQGPATLLLAAPTAARHGHHGTFWTGHWFSWMGDKDLGSMRSCIHHLVTCNVGCDKTNSSSSMQLTHWPKQRHYLLSHPGEPWRFTPMSEASLDCFLVLHSKQLKRQNWIKTAILHLRG